MEKYFSFNKWFVFFCALLVTVWLALQYVTDQRLEETAKIVGRNVFSWDWPDMGWNCTADIISAHVQKRDKASAIVKITGKQTMPGDTEDLSATLTFYIDKKQWILGKVEFN